MAIVLPVLCECGFQYHGEHPAAAFTGQPLLATIKKVLVFSYTLLIFYAYATSLRRQNILKIFCV